MRDLIKIEKLTKKFDGVTVLNEVDLTVEQGDVVAIIGPSGSGKSTFLRSLIRLEEIDGGSIAIDGEYFVKDGVYVPENEARRICFKMGMCFQQFNLFPHKTVLENLTEAPVTVHGMKKEKVVPYAKELLQKVGLLEKADVYPSQLSGGQQQRVAIARALAIKPDIILFDEPTSALDPELTGEVLRTMRKLAEDKMTMLITTHEMAFAREVATKVIFLADGVIAEQGDPKEVFDHPKSERLAAFLEKILH